MSYHLNLKHFPLDPCDAAAALASQQVFEWTSPFRPQRFCTCYFTCLENSLSATCTPDSFSHSPGLSLERPSWTTPPEEGPSLDTVIVCPGSFKALTTIKIILLNCLLLFIHQPHILSRGGSLQTQNNSRSPPTPRFLLNGAATEPGREFQSSLCKAENQCISLGATRAGITSVSSDKSWRDVCCISTCGRKHNRNYFPVVTVVAVRDPP